MKVFEIIMWSWTENSSCQGPEHAHIDLIKSGAHLTNTKDDLLCILHYYCRCGLVQQYEQMLENMVDGNDCEFQPLQVDQATGKIELALTGDRNLNRTSALLVSGGTLPEFEGHAEP